MRPLPALDVIRRLALFSSLTDEQARSIAGSVVRRRFKRGDLVVTRGERVDSLFILLTGRARVLASNLEGREVIIASLRPGDYMGEMSLLDNEPQSTTVRVEVQSDMLVLGHAEFARCLSESASLSYAVMRGLVRRLRAANRQIHSLALLDVSGRVAQVLMDMAEEVDELHLIREKVSRQHLAKVVGASREMVSRVMADLEARGMIQTRQDGSVVIAGPLV